MRGSTYRPAILACAVTFAFAGAASGVEWLVVGARQRGMGGAGVATADESSAVYWNPAALSTGTNWSVGIDTSFSAEVAPGTLVELERLVSTITDLQTEYSQLLNQFTRLSDGTANDEDLATVLKFVLTEFSSLDRKDLGLLFGANVGLSVQAGSFGVAVGTTVYADMGLVADLTGLAMANGGTAIQNMVGSLNGLDTTGLPLAVDYTGTDPYVQPLALELQGIMESSGITTDDAAKMAAALIYVSSYDSGDPGSPDNVLEGPIGGLPVTVASNFAGADLSDPKVRSMLVNMVNATLGSGALIQDNETGVHLRGAWIWEAGISKSFQILKNRLSVGVTGKMISARTLNIEANYADYSGATGVNDAMQDLVDQVTSQVIDNPLDSSQFGLDIGVDFKLNKFVRLAMVIKNLTRPQFDMPNTSDKFVLEPQVRAGVAAYPLPWICITADMDLTENRSQIATDYGTRFFALGAEVTVLKVVQLRAGLYGNLLVPGEQPAVTAGLGLKFGPVFKLDVALNLKGNPADVMNIMGGGSMEISNIPEGAGISLSMQFRTKF